MTREEQLDWLYRLRSEIYVFMPKEWLIPMNNALDMVIKSLEQEPCEDCVSRADVETFLDKYNFVSYDYTVEDLVKALPYVTPKIETGHWSRKTKVDAYDLAGVKTWGIKCQCDRCTFTTTVVEDFGYYTYCPNCGAKMEREE